jgi:hypothetical protein
MAIRFGVGGQGYGGRVHELEVVVVGFGGAGVV